MKELPDEKTMLEILELVKDFENSARELSEVSMQIALKYQKQVSVNRQSKSNLTQP